jgi:hypothetical protein
MVNAKKQSLNLKRMARRRVARVPVTNRVTARFRWQHWQHGDWL